MEVQDCLEVLREIKDVAFATMDEEGMPQVRIIDVMLVENEKLYFCTARGKSFYNQLMNRKKVALTGLNKAYQMVRLNGSAEKLEKKKRWIDHIFKANPTMNDVYPGNSRYILEPFCIENGQLEFYDLGKKPIYRKSFTMRDKEIEERGFYITKSCIGCGYAL